MKHYTLYNTCKLMLLVTVLGALGVGDVWGQGQQRRPEKPADPSDTAVKNFITAFSKTSGGSTIENDYGVANIPVDEWYSTGKQRYEEYDTGAGKDSAWIIDIEWDLANITYSFNTKWPRGLNYTEPQNITLQNTSDESIHGKATRVIYAHAGEPKSIKFQDAGGSENLDGFLRWYITDENGDSASAPANLEWSAKWNGDNETGFRFGNGLAWLRGETTKHTEDGYHLKLCLRWQPRSSGGGDWVAFNTNYEYSAWTTVSENFETTVDSSPVGASTVIYTVPNDAPKDMVYYLVCEASANNNASQGGTNSIKTPDIAVKTVYEIHVIDDARTSAELTESKIPLDKPEKMVTFKNMFLESYEIHTPIEAGTNYRLAEPLANYYVPRGPNGIIAPNWVRWKAYDEKGDFISGSEIYKYNSNVNNYTFNFTDLDKRYTYYLTAEVAYGTSTTNAPEATASWHPVSFLTVYLEPYSEALTQLELAAKVQSDPEHYQERSEEYLKEEGLRYKLVKEISFDESIETALNWQNNYLTETRDDIQSYYAFANPGDNQHRKNQRRSAGRGEYAFYRSLNVSDVSTTDQDYNDFFMTNGSYQNIQMVDRLKEKSGNSYGSFLYLDATDDPGVITKINVGQLCRYTTLIVSAWICDMVYSEGAEKADVGFTFKRLHKDGTSSEEKEIILSKFYSGKVGRATSGNTAQWKQVFFQFSITEADEGDDYILEIANNTPSSNGADYGIDDIQIWRSLPDIEVNRKNECETSTLLVQSNFKELLENMGWTENEDVPGIDLVNENPNLKKYRYGLKNLNLGGDYGKDLTTVGNVYFSFVENLKVDSNGDPLPGQDDVTDFKGSGVPTGGGYHWVVINQEAVDNENVTAAGAYFAIRVALSTNLNLIPTDSAVAMQAERALNIQAVRDYNEDNPGAEIQIGDVDSNITDAEYQAAIIQLYNKLQIPRIRCPWRKSNTIYLSSIDVTNTHLKYEGEYLKEIDQNGNLVNTGKQATGKYHVMMFSALEVSAPGSSAKPTESCALLSPFTVKGAMNIQVDTETPMPEVALCAGALRKLNVVLNGFNENTLEPVEINTNDYFFDWYLDTKEEYDKIKIGNTGMSLKQAIEMFRGENTSVESITVSDIDNWSNSSLEVTEKEAIATTLKDLLEAGLLATYTKPKEDFLLKVNGEQIVAMPYIKTGLTTDGGFAILYCTNEATVDFDLAESAIPELYPGMSAVTYPETFVGGAPLRLGLMHLDDKQELTIPLRTDNIKIVDNKTYYLGAPAAGSASVHLDSLDLDYPEIGTLESLEVGKDNSPNTLKLKWNADAKQYFKEGGIFHLLVPFVQRNKDTDEVASSECDGLLSVEIKVVPEYLTWKGDADAVWYNDNNWNQSTEKELYMGSNGENTDANGSDPIENAFAPLYFTKITIDPNKRGSSGELVLEEPNEDGDGFLSITTNGKATENIQYDLAVDKDQEGNLKVKPYYINKVSEIYFKPKAKLVNQHRLDYSKAWVEFEIPDKGKRWMTSPLQDVYAGDIYAPTSGRQETEAFAPINYTNGTYSRWNPAFYQKAWNEAVTYYTTPDGASPQSVDAVQSNWSIEYNDVNVPYKIGKGFYLSVEDVTGGGSALVRLPKADAVSEYKYETKSTALRAELSKTNSGKLVNMENNDGELGFTLNLNEVYGDGKHFLIGNPFMSNLDMERFFEKNGNQEAGQGKLVKKYWVLKDGATSATVVGTPDVGFEGGEGENGIVEPMQAFFVELDGELNAANSTVIFTPEMMITTKKSEKGPSTKSASAVNPIITLTAERGDVRSVARLITSDKADNNYKESEDAVVLLDSELDAPMVYSVAGNRAAQVNALRSIDNIPVGVYNSRKGDVTVMIEGMAQLAEPLYLYDAYTRKSTLLEGDSHTLEISGESHGRYYLRSSAIGSVGDNAIAIYSVQSGKVIVSSTQEVRNIKVYSLSGAMVKNYVNLNTPQYTFNLPAGVYVVHAEGKDGTVKVEKVIVR